MILQASSSGQRLDVFLSESETGLTRAGAQKLLEAGLVRVNGAPAKKNTRLSPGDRVELEIPEEKTEEILPQKMDLEILYEDDNVLVINKPKGLVVHPAAGHRQDTLVNGLLYLYPHSLSHVNGGERPGIVHRIDKDTSGLLAVAKNDEAHRYLAEQLQDHTMCRTYEAVVCGGFQEDCGTVDAPLGRSSSDRKKMCVTDKNSRTAVTHWEVIRRYGPYTHVRCRLETGRTHQIRVHMAYIGRPVLGDTVYGRKKPELGQSSQCLHAVKLEFYRPGDGKRTEVVSPLPEYFRAVLDRLERMYP